MELSKKIFGTVLKGVNDLEGNHIKSFVISELTSREAFSLQTCYLFNYNFKMDLSNGIYNLTISKLMINQRK